MQIKAEQHWPSEKSILYKIDYLHKIGYAKIWIPKKIHTFDEKTGILTVEDWFYNKEILPKIESL